MKKNLIRIVSILLDTIHRRLLQPSVYGRKSSDLRCRALALDWTDGCHRTTEESSQRSVCTDFRHSASSFLLVGDTDKGEIIDTKYLRGLLPGSTLIKGGIKLLDTT